MSTPYILIGCAGFLALTLSILWIIEYGWVRGVLASLCRWGWCSLFLLTLFPQTLSTYVPQAVQTQPVSVLIDDSQSMGVLENPRSPLSQAENVVTDLTELCKEYACEIKVEKLSNLNKLTLDGYTPLRESFESWLKQADGRPWVLLSDGGDWQPQRGRNSKGAVHPPDKNGRIVDLFVDPLPNVWVDDLAVPVFSFVEKPVPVDFVVSRNQVDSQTNYVQVQFYSDDKLVQSKDVNFGDDLEVRASVKISPLTKGSHSIHARIVPFAGEKTLWDNQLAAPIDVLPNTIGVLHLLEAPNWDGRFFRRFLKSEPKFDVISFFILRDKWDGQAIDERELSLIQFPSQRLFSEELPNFKTLVFQNFTLFQFLEPQYQKNLVKFVKDGGGLIFIGGPRALQMSDIEGSPLKEILPFTVKKNIPGLSAGGHETYDRNLEFSLRLANPSAGQRMLANVYEDWKFLEPSLIELPKLKGMHRTDRFEFDAENSTPLLEAETSAGQRLPLAVASYPGKGRAIWIFTDELWKLAMASEVHSARQVYNQFMQAGMSWLLRDEIKKPLILSGFQLRQVRADDQSLTEWEIRLEGPAARYMEQGGTWTLQVCDQIIKSKDILQERMSLDQWRLSGRLPAGVASGHQCWAKIEAAHASFGAIQAKATAIVPHILNDQEILGSSLILKQLANQTGGEYTLAKDFDKQTMRTWLGGLLNATTADVQTKLDTSQDYFWAFKTWWAYALLLLLPCEILVRRWKDIFA